MIKLPTTHRVLVVDDEPDFFPSTVRSLRPLERQGKSVQCVQATSGQEAIEAMRSHPLTAVILLDVVMETDDAGLVACKTIREDLNNRNVRILLRTGAPGKAPEKEVIDNYDIDGYWEKGKMTSTRLYTAVRTAIRAFEDLFELDRHRELLSVLHDSAVKMRSYEALELALHRILFTSQEITDSPLSILSLQTFEEHGNPRTCMLHLPDTEEVAAKEMCERIAKDAVAQAMRKPEKYADGMLIPLMLHRGLGRGWIYLKGKLDKTLSNVLSTLAAHAENALYASVAQDMLEARGGPFFDEMTI